MIGLGKLMMSVVTSEHCNMYIKSYTAMAEELTEPTYCYK